MIENDLKKISSNKLYFIRVYSCDDDKVSLAEKEYLKRTETDSHWYDDWVSLMENSKKGYMRDCEFNCENEE